ncbi:hypothetical protein G7Y79_00002g005420 [Physcia stellaris]|nr:hypothetical protein G7Y79_00002g005420 [Physcia stellaris]
MPSDGLWAWIPNFLIPKNATGLPENISDQVNICHVYGETDSYRPSYQDLRDRGIVPPPRDSGSRVFRSKRRTAPNKGGVIGPKRIAKKARSPTKAQPKIQTFRPTTRMQTRSSARGLQDHAKLVMPSTPPPNAPKAPLTDRLQSLDSCFTNLDVANTFLPAHRAPFKDYISSTLCTHHLCSIAEPHQEGLYLHEGKLSSKPHNYFGATNPPEWLWKAFERVEASEASEMDFINLQYFLAVHGPYFQLCKEELWE